MIDYKKKSFVAVSAIWFERYLECSRTQGTPEFTKSVWRFYHSLLNLEPSGKLAIKDIAEIYVDKTWNPELLEKVRDDCERNNVSIDQNHDMMSRQLIYDSNVATHIIHLFSYITQSIQDSGVGWPSEQQMQTFIYSQE